MGTEMLPLNVFGKLCLSSLQTKNRMVMAPMVMPSMRMVRKMMMMTGVSNSLEKVLYVRMLYLLNILSLPLEG